MKALKNVMLFGFCVLLVSMLGLTLQTDVKGATSGDFTYELLNRNSVEITRYNGRGYESIAIPRTLGGKPVVEIGQEAFCNCNVRKVTIPNSVVVINYGAFYDCHSLVEVTMSLNVNIIGDRAFYGCHSLAGVIIPHSVIEIGEEAFCDCRSLMTLEILYGVTYIGDRAFFNCGSLTSVIMPPSVTNIGNEAFAYCRELKKVIVENGQKVNIAANAFLNTPWDDKIYKLSICDILLPQYLPPPVYNGLYQAPIYSRPYLPPVDW